MEGRCAVQTVAQLGRVPGGGGITAAGPLVLVWDGSEAVRVLQSEEKRIVTTLQFPGPVRSLVHSEEQHLLYAACESAVYCVNLHMLMSRISPGAAPPSSLTVSSDWLAVREERVCSLLLVGSILLTLAHRDRLWRFTLYKVPSSLQSSAGGHQQVGGLDLPLVSGLGDDGEPRSTPVLNCVHCSDGRPSSSPSSSSRTPTGDGHFLLESLLFKILFGVDAALARSPIILCGLPDGRLAFFPLCVPPPRVRLLHSLEQPVVFIGSLVATGTDPPLPQCLVAVGGLGRVALIRAGGTAAPEAGQKVAAFTEGCVPGPVACGCVFGRRLYYSTRSDVLVLDLSGGPEQAAGGLPGPVSLNVCGMVAMGRATHSAAAGEGAVQLLGLSARGRLQSITIPGGGAAGGAGGGRELPSLPTLQIGRRTKDLLAALGDVCERATRLKASIHSKAEVLRKLNQLLHISCLLLSNHKREDHLPLQERPIRCHAVCGWSRLLQRDTLNLTCVLQNSSPYVLEQGWTLCITPLPLSPPLGQGGEGSSTTFSFPIQNLCPGGSFEVSLPLATAGSTSFPVTVSFWLVFMFTHLLGGEEPSPLLDPRLPGPDAGCLTLPVDTLTVDWLDALRVSRPADAVPPMDWACVDPLQAFLNSREVKGHGGRGDAGGTLRPEAGETHSACVRVSRESLSAALEWAAPRGSKVAATSLSLPSVLDWLLPSSGGPAMRGGSDSVVSAQCLDGHRVTLTAKEVTLGEQDIEAGGGLLKTVEIWVECSSMATVCGLHHAVLRRVQNLLLRAPEHSASPRSIQASVLQRALQKAEASLQRIQESRVPEGSASDFAKEKMNQSILRIYRELRDEPLLIV